MKVLLAHQKTPDARLLDLPEQRLARQLRAGAPEPGDQTLGRRVPRVVVHLEVWRHRQQPPDVRLAAERRVSEYAVLPRLAEGAFGPAVLALEDGSGQV